MKVYDFKVKDMNGNEVSLADYKGKVLLILNSATACGFTPQYGDLKKLYDTYADQGFVILDFPCNQFHEQAPGSDKEIFSFCETKYGVKFPIFSKLEVKGENAHPLYKYLISQKGFSGFNEEHPIAPRLMELLDKEVPDYKNTPDIKWNFTKFLIDRDGNVVERFEPTEEIYVVESRIKGLL
jgi:glutathione peroxidase